MMFRILRKSNAITNETCEKADNFAKKIWARLKPNLAQNLFKLMPFTKAHSEDVAAQLAR